MARGVFSFDLFYNHPYFIFVCWFKINTMIFQIYSLFHIPIVLMFPDMDKAQKYNLYPVGYYKDQSKNDNYNNPELSTFTKFTVSTKIVIFEFFSEAV